MDIYRFTSKALDELVKTLDNDDFHHSKNDFPHNGGV